MKSIKEKQLLVKWSQAMNEPVDAAIVEEVERYERIKQDILISVKQNTLNDLKEASLVANEVVEKVRSYPKPPTVDELMQVLKEEQHELVQAQTTQEPTIQEDTRTLADRAAEHLTQEARLEEKADSYQQPNPALVDKNLNAIQKKLKFLEQAIGKIAAHGSGGGDGNPFDKVEFMERGVRFTPTPRMMYWNNTEDCVNIVQNNVTMRTGLDNYIRIHNHTGNVIEKGTFVQFAGVDLDVDAPLAVPFVNNANTQPLYSIGIVASDVSDNGFGKASTLGYVRGIDTTGNAVGESWAIGDLLWANPSYPGKLTKVKPTAPNVAVSVAAVMEVDGTEGQILVRPTIWPRLFYGSFFSTQPQLAANTTSAFAITLNKTEFASGFVIENNSRIKALNSGLYNFQFSIQFTSTNAAAKQIYIFPKKNGVNIPDSSTVYTITGNGTNFVPYLNYVISLNANEYVEIYFGVSDISAEISSPTVPAYSPNIPPVILTVTEVAI